MRSGALSLVGSVATALDAGWSAPRQLPALFERGTVPSARMISAGPRSPHAGARITEREDYDGHEVPGFHQSEEDRRAAHSRRVGEAREASRRGPRHPSRAAEGPPERGQEEGRPRDAEAAQRSPGDGARNRRGARRGKTASVSTFNTLQPPAPTISQTLTTIPVGYTFSFYQVRLPLGSRTAISTYKIYRATTSSNTAAQVVQTISHNPANNGIPIVVQDAQPNGVNMFYWVSAVSTAGLESSMTAAQTGTVTSNAGFNSNSQLASTFHNNPVNSSFRRSIRLRCRTIP